MAFLQETLGHVGSPGEHILVAVPMSAGTFRHGADWGQGDQRRPASAPLGWSSYTLWQKQIRMHLLQRQLGRDQRVVQEKALQSGPHRLIVMS